MLELLDKDSKERVETAASEFLKKNHALDLPVDIMALTKRLKMQVDRQSFNDPEVTGLILVNENEKIPGTRTNRLIILSAGLNEERSRFITAHEMGHFVLHIQGRKKQSLAYRDSNERNESKDELEAELFARAVLMPKLYMESAAKYYRTSELRGAYTLPQYIGALFEVTENKAGVRLEELGLLQAV